MDLYLASKSDAGFAISSQKQKNAFYSTDMS